MKASYLLGLLLILVTAFSNMAMAQLSPSMEKNTPESVKKYLRNKPPAQRSFSRIGPTTVRPVYYSASLSINTDINRPLRLLLERKAHPNESIAQSMARVSRSSFAPQPMMMQARNYKPKLSPQQIDQMKAAEREAIRAEFMARRQRKH